jgi:hypothetical protein
LCQFFNGKFSGPIVTNFISELINLFAEFVFYSFQTVNEIKEIDIVKNALQERLKKYKKLILELENEIVDLQKLNNTNKEIKEILLRQRQDVEVKYSDSLTQVSILKDDLNVKILLNKN